jgi:chromosome segregation ATPase
MDILGLIIGAAIVSKDAAIGAVLGAAVCTVISMGLGAMGMKSRKQAYQQELDQLLAVNEKLRSRNREAERHIEDLTRDLRRANTRFMEKDDTTDDLEDELAHVKSRIKRLTQQNGELLRKIQEYQTACESYEREITQLRNK